MIYKSKPLNENLEWRSAGIFSINFEFRGKLGTIDLLSNLLKHLEKFCFSVSEEA